MAVAELMGKEMTTGSADEGGAETSFSVWAIGMVKGVGTVAVYTMFRGSGRLVTNRTKVAGIRMTRPGSGRGTVKVGIGSGRRVVRNLVLEERALGKMGIQADACGPGRNGDGGAATTTGVVLELEVSVVVTVVVVGVQLGLALGRIAV